MEITESEDDLNFKILSEMGPWVWIFCAVVTRSGKCAHYRWADFFVMAVMTGLSDKLCQSSPLADAVFMTPHDAPLKIHFTGLYIRFADYLLWPLCFFLCLRWARALDLCRALPKKHQFFSAHHAHWIVADFRKKHLISGCYYKANIRKKQVHFRRKKIISSYVFLLVFFIAHIRTFSKNGSKVFFCFVALINFSRNLSNDFYLIALINVSKNRLNVFFLEWFSSCPPSLYFDFFPIQDREIKRSGL